MNLFSHSAGSAADVALVPQQVLEDGEIVIITVKPSLWLIPLTCWPVALAAGIAAGAVHLLGKDGAGASVVLVLCLGAVALKTGLATLNWLGRLYVLTNRRVLTLHGVMRCEVGHCPLEHLQDIHVTAAMDARLVRVGNLVFDCCPGGRGGTTWDYVGRPDRLRQDVLDAIARYRP